MVDEVLYEKNVFSEKINLYGKIVKRTERDFTSIYGGKQK